MIKKSDITPLKEAITIAIGDKAVVSSMIPKTLLEIRDIDETVDKEEAVQAIGRELNLPAEQLRGSCRLFSGYGRMQIATVLLPTEQARKLLNKGKIRIGGWIECRIREKYQVTRCYKCLGFGHISKICRGPDRSKVCYKCGKTGHILRNCKNIEQCVICKEKNLSADHMMGSKKCGSFSAEMDKIKKRNAKFYTN